MISTKGIELANFINPDLTWKTVSKGYRSTTRRSRKQVDQSPKSDADLVDRGMESPSDTTVSESEKLGVAVLGQRFSDKTEPVPIKKRRLTVRSPSPPRYFSPNNKSLEPIGHVKQPCKKSMSKKQLFTMGASTRRRKVNHIYGDDFYAIEMLATTACNNNMCDDVRREECLVAENPAPEDRDRSSMAFPLKECILCEETTHSSQTDAVIGGAKEGSISQHESDTSHTGAEDDQQNLTDQKTVEKSASSRDVRLHWDLNVEMDAWETPCETDAHTNADQNLQVLEACELKKETRDINVDDATLVQSVRDRVEERVETSSCIDRNEDKFVPVDEVIDYSTSAFVAKISQNVASDSLASNSSCLVSENVNAAVLSEEAIEKSSSIKSEVKEMENDQEAITAQLGMNEKLEVIACKVEIALLSENGDSKLPQKMASSTGSHSLVLIRKAEEMEVDVGEAILHESTGDSRANPVEVFQRVATEATKHESHVLNASDNIEKGNSKAFETGYDSQYEDGELRESDAPPYWEEVDYEECVDYGSDTCDDATAFSMPSKFGMQTDCSEEDIDGRERSLDRNANVDNRVFGYGYDGVSEHGIARDSLRQKSVSLKIKMSGSEEVPRCSEMSTNSVAEAPEGCLIRKQTAVSIDVFDGKDSPTKVVVSGQSRKEQPGIGEQLVSDASYRNDSALVQRNRPSNFDFYTHSEEARADCSMGKDRSDLQVHPKSPVGLAGASGSSYWDSRRRESSPFRGTFGSDRSRPRNNVESRSGYTMHSEGGAVGGTDNYGHRQTMNSFSNGSYRYPIRRRSPGNRDEPYSNTHRGMMPMRDGSPDRRRFRRYPQGVGRGFREYHQRPMPPNESEDYPHHVTNRMVRRDQNSPPPNRGHVYYRRPYKRSQSRSRSRSPSEWVVSRDQHDVAKHRNNSRSPDFRFDNRMQRMRLPFQKQNFGAKYEVGFLSPQRRRFSPHHNNNNNNNNNNYRWFDDQNGGSDFRGRRVPGRPFQQGQRFDSVGSSRRMNSDDYYEPVMRPARFSEMGRGRGRGGSGSSGGGARRYEGSDDERRRPDGRYENQMYPRVKRCESDGLRRIRIDEEDSFVPRNSNNYNDSDNNNNNNSGGERRPRNVYVDELVKRKAN